MKLTFKNYEIAPAIELLQPMDLGAADSRHRTKFVKLLMDVLKGIQESQQDLLDRYGKKDEDGNLIQGEDGKGYEFDPIKGKEYLEELQKLVDEEVVIEGGTYQKNIEEMPRILNEYTGTLSGKEADIYDRLLDEFEGVEVNEQSE